MHVNSRSQNNFHASGDDIVSKPITKLNYTAFVGGVDL